MLPFTPLRFIPVVGGVTVRVTALAVCACASGRRLTRWADAVEGRGEIILGNERNVVYMLQPRQREVGAR